jgi:hypothetical protein
MQLASIPSICTLCYELDSWTQDPLPTLAFSNPLSAFATHDTSSPLEFNSHIQTTFDPCTSELLSPLSILYLLSYSHLSPILSGSLTSNSFVSDAVLLVVNLLYPPPIVNFSNPLSFLSPHCLLALFFYPLSLSPNPSLNHLQPRLPTSILF